MVNDLLYAVRCAKCGKVEYTLKNTPNIKGWKFVNSRLVCSECIKKKS